MTVATGAASGGAPGDGAAGPSLPLVRWWRGLGRGQQALLAVVGLAVLVNLSLSTVRSLTGGDPGGPASSSFSTGGDGLAAYADLLRADGHRVVRLRDRPAAADLPVTGTAVVVEPDGSALADVELLARFVTEGGHLVLAGAGSADLLAALTGAPVGWRAERPVARLDVWVPVPETGSARTLAGDDGGRWVGLGPLVPVIGAEDRAAMVVADVGAGRVTALADPSLLHNDHLDQADNAALGLALAGEDAAPVVFVEAARRSGSRGLAAVPPGWKWATAGLAVAVALGLWSAGSRAGPPEPQARTLAPPRRDHVDAVAAALDRVTPAGTPVLPSDPPHPPGAHP